MDADKIDKLLNVFYYKSPAAFSSIERLYAELKKKGHKIKNH